MSQHGATLQLYNNELVTCVEELKARRKELQQHILKGESKKAKLQQEIRTLSEQLTQVNEDLNTSLEVRDQYDKLIAETEQAFAKILQSSQALLALVKTETTNIVQRQNTKTSEKNEQSQGDDN